MGVITRPLFSQVLISCIGEACAPQPRQLLGMTEQIRREGFPTAPLTDGWCQSWRIACEFSDRFVSKGVAWQPRSRGTLSLSPMRDKPVISDGSLSFVVKRRRLPRLTTIVCFPTGLRWAVGTVPFRRP